MKLNFFLLIIILLSFSMCSNEKQIVKKIKIFSSDRSQCITIFTGSKVRYITVGNHDKIPERNFVKLDVRNLDLISDIFYGCWNKSGYEWEFYNNLGVILENKLDKTKYKFGVKYPDYYSSSLDSGNCYEFNYLTPKIKENYKEIVSLEVN